MLLRKGFFRPRLHTYLHAGLLAAMLVFCVTLMELYRHFWRWEGWMKINDFGDLRIYMQENAALPPPSGHRVVFFGDSLTYLWRKNDPSFFESDWIDRGVPGETTEELLLRERQDVIDLHPLTLHLLCGVNDMLGNAGKVTLAQIEENVQTLVEVAQLHGIRVVIGLLPPTDHVPAGSIEAYNAWLRSYAERNGLQVVDYYSQLRTPDNHLRKDWTVDGLHPNEQGFRAMSQAANPVLQSAVEVAETTGY